MKILIIKIKKIIIIYNKIIDNKTKINKTDTKITDNNSNYNLLKKIMMKKLMMETKGNMNKLQMLWDQKKKWK